MHIKLPRLGGAGALRWCDVSVNAPYLIGLQFCDYSIDGMRRRWGFAAALGPQGPRVFLTLVRIKCP